MLNKKYSLLVLLFLSVFIKDLRAEEVLSWQGCIIESAKNHPDLIAAEEKVKQSEASEKITASALYPQISSNLNASTARSDSGTSSSNADTYSYGVTGTQLIFDGTKTIQNVKAAEETINASNQNFRYTSVTVRYKLRSAFVELLTAQENLKITSDIYDIRKSNLELITLRYASGLEHKGALMTAEADVANAVYGIDQARRALEVAQRNLIKEMGRQQFSAVLVRGDFQVGDAVKTKPDFEALTKNNPSLKQIIAQKNSAEFSLKAAYANFSPALNGSAGASKSGSSWEPKNDQWNLGLALTMPIFEGGLRIAQVSQAKAFLNQLKENERSIRDGLVATLEQNWAALQDTIENVTVQEKNLLATQERSKIAQAQYSIGLISFDNWTIIEDNLVSAKSNYLKAQSKALLAEASWIQAKGETLEYE